MDACLTQPRQKELLRLARQTIANGCSEGMPPEITPSDFPEDFRQQLACFVTLQKQGQLRGCIGSLQVRRTLVEDVVHNAFASAFRDFRFFPVTESELSEISVEISILTPMTPIDVSSEEELLRELEPGVDGLVIENEQHSATFLPQVWEQLPEPEQFLQHLKRKAGLQDDHWPEDMRCFRYHCEKFKEQEE